MVIKYLDSKRISALAADTKPTNVETNSILVEKDTGKRRWFNGTAWAAENWDINDDFSSYLSQGTADAVWIPDSTAVDVNITADNLNMDRTGSDQTVYRDVLGANVSDTAWVCRYTLNHSAGSFANLGEYHGFFMSDTVNTHWATSVDGIGSRNSMHASAAYLRTMSAWDTEGSSMSNVGEDAGIGDFSVATGTIYPCETIRLSATTHDFTKYDNDSDYTEGTNDLTAAGTCTSTTQSLRYFTSVGNTGTGGSLVSQLDLFKFADGVTTAP